MPKHAKPAPSFVAKILGRVLAAAEVNLGRGDFIQALDAKKIA